MKPWKLSELEAVLHCAVPVEAEITCVSTDTRDLPAGCLFVALRGEKFDGHAFVEQAIAAGAVAAVTDRQVGDCPCLVVKDTGRALQQIARFYREKFHPILVGITGERFDEIKAILGLTDVDCKKIFTINRLENKEGRSFFREVFIRRGTTSGVYGVEEPRECYMTYTTERAEKEALKLYKRELRCSHQEAIEAYCRDWNASGIGKSLPFAQKVNEAGRILNLHVKQ